MKKLAQQLLLLPLLVFCITSLHAQEKKESGSWFDDLKKGVEEVLSDEESATGALKKIPKLLQQGPTPEGIEFFKQMESEYAKQLKDRSIMKGVEDERTMGLIVNLQQPADQADSPLSPVAAFIYNKPDLIGETDFTLVTALVFNRIDFSTPINSDLEFGYGAEMQVGIAGSTLYHEGIEQKAASYEGDSLPQR